MSSDFWDKHAHQYDAEVQKRDDDYITSLARIRDLIKRDDTILDYGCGSGQIAIDLAQNAGFVHGIDFSAKMVDLAKTKGASTKNVRFSRVDIFDDALKPGSFDAILALDILHLIEDPLAVLMRISDLLKDEGLLISTTPCFGDHSLVFRLLIGLARAFHLAPTIYYLKASALQAMVEKAGLSPLNSEKVKEKLTKLWLVAEKPST